MNWNKYKNFADDYQGLDKAPLPIYIRPSSSGVPFKARDEKGIPFNAEAAPQL